MARFDQGVSRLPGFRYLCVNSIFSVEKTSCPADTRLYTERLAPRFLLRARSILELVGSPGRFLEVGAGSGDFLRILEDHGFKGTAIEPSDPSRNEIQRKLRSDRIQVTKNWPTQSSDHQYVFILEVLEHLEHPEELLNQCKTYMQAGTQLVVSVPAHPSRWTEHDQLAGHWRRYRKAELIHLLESCGYTLDHVVNYGFPLLNFTNRLRGRLARRDPRWKLSPSDRTLTSGANRWRSIPKLAKYSVRILTDLCHPLQRAAWRKDWGDGYIALARLTQLPYKGSKP